MPELFEPATGEVAESEESPGAGKIASAPGDLPFSAIIARQASREARLAAADDVIDNSGTLADLLPQIDRLDLTYRSN